MVSNLNQTKGESMKRLIAVAVLAMAVMAVPVARMVAFAAQDAPVTYTANVGNGFSCGANTGIVRCVGVPLNNGNTFWIQAIYSGYQAGTGFIVFGKNLDQALITSVSAVGPAGQPATVTVTFKNDPNLSVSGFDYTGKATFTFVYFPAPKVGSGRGGGYPRPTYSMTSGKIEITYN